MKNQKPKTGDWRWLLKALNPFLWLANFCMYCSHLDAQAGRPAYEPYDFSGDFKYF
jgi:hypothetical protein